MDFLEDVKREVGVVDLFLLFSVPFVLSVVFLLPENLRQFLVLDYNDLSFLNMLSTVFVHRGFVHYSFNLLSYVFLVVPGYLLSVLSGERRIFHLAFVSNILLLPFLLNVLTLFLFDPGSSVGFSGVNSGFLGFLCVALYIFLHNRISDEVEVVYATSLFGVAAAMIAWIYTGVSILSLSILSGALFLQVLDLQRIGRTEIRKIGVKLGSSRGYFELLVFGFMVFLTTPLFFFPQDISQGETVVNIFSHYTGLIFGIFIPLLYLRKFPKNLTKNNEMPKKIR